MHNVTIMSKPGCHLCEQAAEVIRKVIRVPAIIDMVDITKNQELLAKYKNDIPVILVDGVERFRHRVDPDKLAALFMDEPGESILGIS
jgi:glutaredoxin